MREKILEHKFTFFIALFTLVSMVGGGLCFFGNVFWADKEKNEAAHQAIMSVQTRAEIDKTRIEGDIKVINERTTDMQKQQGRMDRKLDRIWEKIK